MLGFESLRSVGPQDGLYFQVTDFAFSDRLLQHIVSLCTAWEARNVVQGPVPTFTELWEASSSHRASATSALAQFGALLQQQAEPCMTQ